MSVGYHVKETCLGIALLLAPSVQPIVQALNYVPSEFYDLRVVSVNSIVMVIANKYLINPSDDILGLFRSFHPDAFMQLLAFLRELLSASFPPYSESAIPGFGTDVCES